MRDDLCTPRIAASQISTVKRADKCLHACLAHAAPVFRLRQSSPGRTTSSLQKPAPRSSSLSLCISVSPHHGSGRPTKAFFCKASSRATKSTQRRPTVFRPAKRRKRSLWKVEAQLRLEDRRKIQPEEREGGSRAKTFAVESPF